MNFSAITNDLNETKCFNISADYSVVNLCSFFTDCNNHHLTLELSAENGSRVSFIEERNVTDIEVQFPAMCVCEEDTAAAGINIVFVVVPSVAVVVIAIVGIVIVILALCYKKKIDEKR